MSFKTTDYLTKFEFTRVVGMRILQLNAHGALAEHPRQLAIREIMEGLNPTVVRRKLPDGSVEDREVRSLQLSSDLRRMCEKMCVPNAADVGAS